MLRFQRLEDYNYFLKVKEFALSGSFQRAQSFFSTMNWLTTYGGEDDLGRQVYDCFIFPDWSPHSFVFNIVAHRTRLTRHNDYIHKGDHVFNGGIIYYGPGESGVHMPQLSVRVGDTSQEEWRVNT